MTAEKPLLNGFSVDLEDWFQGLTSTNPQVERWPSLPSRVVATTDILLKLLAEHRVRATFFVLGHVADHHPDLIERIAIAGHEIASHGYWHHFVNRLTPETFAYELERGVAALQQITGSAPIGHRAPYFSIDGGSLWALDVLRRFGFRYDSSFFPTRNVLYGYPQARREPHRPCLESDLIEFPASTVRIAGRNVPMAGGVYLRALPYPFVRWAIHRLHREGLPAIIYLHPWELDLAQPRYPVTPRERVTHYLGRRTLHGKLERMFRDFRFVPLSELLAGMTER